MNIFKKYKNGFYKLTPLGIRASIENNTEQIFITCRGLNDVKKYLINSKIYGLLLGNINLKKINNWNEIKGQSLWINAMTLTLNNLLDFSINLIDDNNKEIEFPSKVKKK